MLRRAPEVSDASELARGGIYAILESRDDDPCCFARTHVFARFREIVQLARLESREVSSTSNADRDDLDYSSFAILFQVISFGFSRLPLILVVAFDLDRRQLFETRIESFCIKRR